MPRQIYLTSVATGGEGDFSVGVPCDSLLDDEPELEDEEEELDEDL